MGHFLLFYTLSFSSPNNQDNKEQSYWYYPFILVYVCTINEDYVMHGSWYIRHNRQEIFGRFFALLPPPPLTIQKMKILKKWEKHLDIISFYTCVPKMTIIWCMVPEIWSVTNIFFCQFGPIFSFSLLNNLDNQNFEKQPQKKQTHLDI